MAGNATGLRIVDLHRSFRPDLGPLHVEKVDIMCRNMDNGEEQDGVCALAVKPLRLIQRQEPDFRSNEAQKIAAHRQ